MGSAGSFAGRLADEDSGEDFLDMGALGVGAVACDFECGHHAVAHADVDHEPGEYFGGELVGDAVCFLGAFEFGGEEGVDAGDVVVDGFLDLVVFDFGDGLEEDAVFGSAGLGDHWVVADESAESVGGVGGADEVLFPLVEGSFAGSFDEGDEEVTF